jgi:DNA-binding NarL/FixJ family response regulator
MPTIRILLVDDNLDFQEAAANFLSTDPDIEIVGRAQSGRSALDQVARLNPTLVLMDLTMPGMDGLEATQYIKTRSNAPRVVILTLYDHPNYRARARAAQADGLVAKSDFGTQLLPLIHGLCE